MIQHGITRDRPSGLFLLVSKPDELTQCGALAWSKPPRAVGLVRGPSLLGSIEAVGAISTCGLEVKFLDPAMTNYGESSLASLLSLIKNESKGIEDDQIPS